MTKLAATAALYIFCGSTNSNQKFSFTNRKNETLDPADMEPVIGPVNCNWEDKQQRTQRHTVGKHLIDIHSSQITCVRMRFKLGGSFFLNKYKRKG